MTTVEKRDAIPLHLLKRKRIAGYVRVSSGKDAMLHSLSAQTSYYSNLIQSRGDWQFAGIYADEPTTGTKSQRPEFQRLLEDCRAGKIDMVITKSITRFARNTVTTLETVRELKLLGIDVFFEKENIHSLSGDGELMLSILASYAQEESRSVSENCIWRIRKQFAQGKPTHSKAYGYLQEGGDFTIVPEEAAVVRQIFADYLGGMGVLAMQKKLLAQGISFSRNGLAGMLRNEKYAGDLLLQKSFISDHLTKRQIQNTGQLPQYYVEDAHEAIIDRATFNAVQAEIARRTRDIPFPSATYPFTGLIRCGICGASYRRKHAAAGTKYEKIVWICSTFNTLGKEYCSNRQIPEPILYSKTEEAGGFEGLRQITAVCPGALSFQYIGERTVDLIWQNPSRRESWTPEMRETARQKSIQQRRKTS